jgi:hypothetical protein
MMSEALSKFSMGWLSGVGLLLFLSVFVGAFLWCTRSGSGEFYRKMSEMPFDEGETHHG